MNNNPFRRAIRLVDECSGSKTMSVIRKARRLITATRRVSRYHLLHAEMDGQEGTAYLPPLYRPLPGHVGVGDASLSVGVKAALRLHSGGGIDCRAVLASSAKGRLWQGMR